jgi:hypothetical protein
MRVLCQTRFDMRALLRYSQRLTTTTVARMAHMIVGHAFALHSVSTFSVCIFRETRDFMWAASSLVPHDHTDAVQLP